jgi:hypothetical protein
MNRLSVILYKTEAWIYSSATGSEMQDVKRHDRASGGNKLRELWAWGRFVGSKRSSAVVEGGEVPYNGCGVVWCGVWCSKLLACSHTLLPSVCPSLHFPHIPFRFTTFLWPNLVISCLSHVFSFIIFCINVTLINLNSLSSDTFVLCNWTW